MTRSTGNRRALTAAGATAVALFLGGVAAPVQAAGSDVVPIDFNELSTIPKDSLSVQARGILRNSNKYAVTTWWNTVKDYDAQDASPYLNFGGANEKNIRPPAAQAMGLATSIRLGIYDPKQTGVSTATAKAITTRLISSLAHTHYSNAGGWGTKNPPGGAGGSLGWQTALWASEAGNAGWMFWDYLSAQQRTEVKNMVESEANRFIGWTPPYYRSVDGKVLYPGDTKSEELAWDANILELAVGMMPNHPNHDRWMDKRIELNLAAHARPEDLSAAKRDTVVNGKSLGQWLKGTNVYDDGTAVNHSRIHPAYMLYPFITANGVLNQGLAGKATPYADLRGFPVVYKALADLKWTPGPAPAQYAVDSTLPKQIDAPGGTIYANSSTKAGDPSDIYYPQANDWGFGSRMDFALVDLIGATVSYNGKTLDHMTSKGGAYWAGVHLGKQLNMQARFSDGHTYANGENTYDGREEMVSDLAGRAVLLRLLGANGKIALTADAF
ncbi:hypothetical protein [Demetria terragena]|uniref:hypothetical protein n=1 Tax=Demetria terragena TaxID=63959 RepID=UPI000369F462|nr:hypothetical protein [Demetria terragena]